MPQPFRLAGSLVLAGALAAAGCEQAKSANPLSPDVAGPLPNVTITAPVPLAPSQGAVVLSDAGPVTLTVQNASTTSTRPLWLQIEVASDAAFSQKVHQAERVSPEADGQTDYRLTDLPAGGRTYFWRARAVDGANEGPFSAIAHFSLTEPVLLEAPQPLEPLGTIATNRPEFRVSNGRVSGPAGEVAYRFEVATAPNESAITAVVTVPAAASGTTTMSLGELPLDRQYFWRVYAVAGEHTSSPSVVVAFRTPPPVVAPPPTAPPVNGGPVGAPRSISPDEALAIIRGVHDAERWDLGSRSSREQRIAFLMRAVGMVHHGHSRFNPRGPDTNWCIKDAGGGRPVSDDVIVRCDSRDAWDLIGSAGADGYSWHLDYIGRLPSGQNVYPPPRP